MGKLPTQEYVSLGVGKNSLFGQWGKKQLL